MKNFISSFFLAYFVWISSGMGVLFVIVFVMALPVGDLPYGAVRQGRQGGDYIL